ncbi:MAG: radical SAM protein [Bacteroidetes bacterium]|nr:radical SAM protein [Bacteroidota bacterium]
MEHFYTIQGEGTFSGHAAYFIRLAGCDVGCVWCDVKESWTVEEHQLIFIDDLIKEIKKHPTKLIVLTGGEPLMYDLTSLTSTLIKNGYQLNIETSGAYPISGNLDWICVSPKKFKKPLPEVLTKANELKCIIYNKSDFSFAEENARFTNKNCRLLLQPEWSKQAQMLPLIVDYVKANPKWQISLQTHKFMNIP